MRDSASDLDELQALLDRSYAAAGAHLRSIFDERSRLTSRELAEALSGIFEMHFATLASDGAPLVAPVDGVFFKGRVWFGLPAESVRSRLIKRDDRVSASYTRGSFAFIVHGTALEDIGHPASAEFHAHMRDLYVAQYGPGWLDWAARRERESGPGFNGWIEPRVMFAKR